MAKTRAEQEQEQGAQVAVVSEAMPQSLESESIKVTLPEIRAPKRTRFWVGTIPGAPYFNVTVPTIKGRGSVCFPRYTEKVVDSPDGTTGRIPGNGGFCNLEDDEIEALKKNVGLRVVRMLASGSGRMLKIDSPGYYRSPVDRPLGEFLYMVRWTPQMPGIVREGYGQPMVRP